MPHFDEANDRVVGSYEYNGKTYQLLQYKDPKYRPSKQVTVGTKGGRHRCVYVGEAPDNRYIRVPEAEFAGVGGEVMGGVK